MSSVETHHAADGHPAHAPTNYVRVWVILVVLLAVSVAGPMLEIRVVTLATAFGIAVVKAFLVVKHFMHLTVEKKVAQYIVAAMVALMLLFFFAVAPDVMKHIGTNWENHAAENMRKVILSSEAHSAELIAEEEGGKGGHEPAAAKPEEAKSGPAGATHP